MSLTDFFKVVTTPTQVPYFLFIDDTLRHFSASSHILGILVPSSVKTPEEIPELSKNGKKKWSQNMEYMYGYDSQSGISTTGFYILAQFIIQHKSDIKKVVLDWDKTITTHSSFKHPCIDKTIMECYFGGSKRMKAVQHFFEKMKKEGIEVIILTANTRANYDAESFQKGLSYVKAASNIPIVFTDMIKTKYITKKLL